MAVLANCTGQIPVNRNLLRATNADHKIVSRRIVSQTAVTSAIAVSVGSANNSTIADWLIAGGAVTTGIATVGIAVDAPTFAQCGLEVINSWQIACTTADAVAGATKLFYVGTAIDQADATLFSQDYFTFSFWAKCNAVSTYSIRFGWNGTTQQIYSTPITFTASWAKYTITVQTPFAIAGAARNACGMSIKWILLAGSNFQITDNAWTTYNANNGASSSNSNFFSSTSNRLNICLPKLEAGQVATVYDYRSRCQEIELLQPWIEWDENGFYNAIRTGTTTTIAPVQFLSQKIAAPTIQLFDSVPNINSQIWFSTTGTSTNRATTGVNITTSKFGLQQTTALNYQCSGYWRADARATLFNF